MIDYENLGKLNNPFFEEYQKSFSQTLQSGWYVLGNNVKNFESEFAEYTKSKFCIGVASGLDALVLALRAFSFKPGSEVIVPSNTYIATILSIVQCGLVPVLVEPDILTYNIDPCKIEEKISKKTVAIMPVHLYGKSCKMDSIVEIAKQNGLKIIEDAAQSHGALFKGKMTGTFGEFGAFSYYPTKNLGALGDAGALTTDDFDLAKTILRLRNYGSDVKYYNEIVGFNSRLDEIQAGFLSIKLKSLNNINNHKRKLANFYFANIPSDYILPVVDEDYFDVYHIFNIRHKKRNELRAFLLEKGIKTEIHYPVSPNNQKAMQGIIFGEFPISEEIHATTLSLPISYFHTEDDAMKVCESLERFLKK